MLMAYYTNNTGKSQLFLPAAPGKSGAARQMSGRAALAARVRRKLRPVSGGKKPLTNALLFCKISYRKVGTLVRFPKKQRYAFGNRGKCFHSSFAFYFLVTELERDFPFPARFSFAPIPREWGRPLRKE